MSDTDPLEAKILLALSKGNINQRYDAVLDLLHQEKKEAERLGREAMQRMCEKELKMHRTFMANVLAKENLKTEKTLAVCDVCADKLIQPPNTEQEQS